MMHGVIKDIPLKAHNVTTFVDDRFKTIQGLSERGSVILPTLYKRPWNQGRAHSMPILEIDDLRGILPWVITL